MATLHRTVNSFSFRTCKRPCYSKQMGKGAKKLNCGSRRGRRKKRRIRAIWFGLFVLLCAFLAARVIHCYEGDSLDYDGDTDRDAVVVETEDVPWNLILVNKWNPLPDDFDIEFTLLSNGQRVDSRIYPDLQLMFDDARNEGIYPFVREGYRTHEEQMAIFDDKVAAFMREGYRKRKAKEMAGQWVAIPGTSEHELGLAVDINADKERSSNEEVYDWLAENAWRYGFILRYPQGKEDITGIDYEPWHYRYVGGCERDL